jgi:hypothetical protein
MFGLFKSNSNSSLIFIGNFKSNQKDFLERADEAYLLTFKQMDMSYFAKFASRNLYMMIYRSLTSERSWVGVSNKFKKVTWTMIEQDKEGSFLASKDTIFDKVNVSRQLKLSVADDYRELWGVIKSIDGNYTVERISEVVEC